TPRRLAVAEPEREREHGHDAARRDERRDHDGHEGGPVDHRQPFFFLFLFLCLGFCGLCDFFGFLGFFAFLGFFFGFTNWPGWGWWNVRCETRLRRDHR